MASGVISLHAGHGGVHAEGFPGGSSDRVRRIVTERNQRTIIGPGSRTPARCGLWSKRIRLWSSRNVTSRVQCNEFSMLQWARAAASNRSAATSRLLM